MTERTIIICAVVAFNAVIAVVLFGGAAYAVFVEGRSGWWFLAALAVYSVLAKEVK